MLTHLKTFVNPCKQLKPQKHRPLQAFAASCDEMGQVYIFGFSVGIKELATRQESRVLNINRKNKDYGNFRCRFQLGWS